MPNTCDKYRRRNSDGAVAFNAPKILVVLALTQAFFVCDATAEKRSEQFAGLAGASNVTQTGSGFSGEHAVNLDPDRLAERAAALDLRSAELDARERALSEAKEHSAHGPPARMNSLSGDVSRSLGALVALSNATVTLAAQELGRLASVRAIPSEDISDPRASAPRRHVHVQHAHARRGSGSTSNPEVRASRHGAPSGHGETSLVRTEKGRASPTADLDATHLAQLVAALMMPILFLVVGINAWVYFDQAQCQSSARNPAEKHFSEQSATIDSLRKA